MDFLSARPVLRLPISAAMSGTLSLSLLIRRHRTGIADYFTTLLPRLIIISISNPQSQRTTSAVRLHFPSLYTLSRALSWLMPTEHASVWQVTRPRDSFSYLECLMQFVIVDSLRQTHMWPSFFRSTGARDAHHDRVSSFLPPLSIELMPPHLTLFRRLTPRFFRPSFVRPIVLRATVCLMQPTGPRLNRV